MSGKLRTVTGHLVEVRRYVNVPMRWCEQYPARERWEVWVARSEGADMKLVVHSRTLPARRGHVVTALVLGGQLVGLRNESIDEDINFVREEPPLLLRRCDGVTVMGVLAVALGAAWMWDAMALVVGGAAALLYLPAAVIARFVHRILLRRRVSMALAGTKPLR